MPVRLPHDQVAAVVRRHLPPSEDMFHAPRIPADTLERMRRAHRHTVGRDEPVLAVYEDRFLWDRSGFAFTDERFVWQNFVGDEPVDDCVLEYAHLDASLLRPEVDKLCIAGVCLEVSDDYKVPALYWRLAAALAELAQDGGGPCSLVPPLEQLDEGALIGLLHEHFAADGPYSVFRGALSPEQDADTRRRLGSRLEPDEPILLLHDIALIGKGKPGFVITADALVWAPSLGAPGGRLPWRYLRSEEIRRGETSVLCMGSPIGVLGDADEIALTGFLTATAREVERPATSEAVSLFRMRCPYCERINEVEAAVCSGCGGGL